MVRIHPDPPKSCGAVAQLGERLLCKQEAVGSIPSSSTTSDAASARRRPSARAAAGSQGFVSNAHMRGPIGCSRVRHWSFESREHCRTLQVLFNNLEGKVLTGLDESLVGIRVEMCIESLRS